MGCTLITNALLVVLTVCSEFLVSNCCVESERRTLIKFKDGLNDPENRLSSWSGKNCCHWRGVACDNISGNVIKLNLRNPHPYFSDNSMPNRYGFWNLSGQIDLSLLELKSLRYLDLSLNTFGGVGIPKFIGSMKELRHLNLSQSEFSGMIPMQLGNLSSLQFLDLSGNFMLTSESLNWVSGLVSLRTLEMQSVDLSMVNENWVQDINQLPLLRELRLSNCFLPGIYPSLDVVNFTRLQLFDLSMNNMNARFPQWIVNVTDLVWVDLSSNAFYGSIPSELSELPFLEHIDISANKNLTGNCSDLFTGSWLSIRIIKMLGNNMFGGIPVSIGNMTLLEEFMLPKNNLQGQLPASIRNSCSWKHSLNCPAESPLPNFKVFDVSLNQIHGEIPEWLGHLKSLREVHLGYNIFEGMIPNSLWKLEHLEDIDLVGNRLNGSISEMLGQLSNLQHLDLSFNGLTGTLTETHFANLTNLIILQLSSNSFILNISSSWLPPFQVSGLFMGSNHLGPIFPHWIQNQKKLEYLDLSNASIADTIPEWFWDLSSNLSLLNLSLNQIQGQLPNPFNISADADVDFRSNKLEGPLPLPSSPLSMLDLSHNNFSGSLDPEIGFSLVDVLILALSNNSLTGRIPLSVGKLSSLQVFDFSHNGLFGEIPPGLGNCSYLKALDLSSNYLSGSIPQSFALLTQLKSLHVSNNSLSGEFPLALRNCSSLETIDLGENEFSGSIPTWVGTNLSSLGILRLRWNKFQGMIPLELSHLSSLHVLDLAHNNLSGQIPPSLGNLSAMATNQRINTYLFYGFVRGVYYVESLFAAMGRGQREYNKILFLLTSIDLSHNSLSGGIPDALSKLSGLLVIDLSSNKLSGTISDKIGELKQLLSLDVSENKLSGELPQSFVSLSFLSYLNVSYNNLSGRIPSGGQLQRFEASNYAGNTQLCGYPLPNDCDDDNAGGENIPSLRRTGDEDEGERIIYAPWTYLSVGLGFGVGFIGLYAVLLISKSCSDAYIAIIDTIVLKLSLLSASLFGNFRPRNPEQRSRIRRS